MFFYVVSSLYLIKSIASSYPDENNYVMLFFFYDVMLYNTYSANGAYIASNSSSFGLPINSIILSI